MESVIDVLRKWKVNKPLLASKIGAHPHTFRQKFDGNPPYKFTEAELIRLSEVVAEIASDFAKVVARVKKKSLEK